MKNINLLQLRKKINRIFVSGKYNQKEWAEVLNVSQPSISNYINGRIPPLEVLIKMSKILNVPLEELIVSDYYKKDNEVIYLAEPGVSYRHDEVKDLFVNLPENLQKTILHLLRALVKEQGSKV